MGSPSPITHLPKPIWLAALALVVLAGCVPPRPKTGEVKKPEKKDELPAQRINMPNGSAIEYTVPKKPEEKREPQWYVEWKNAKVDVASNEPKSGRMETVNGYLFDNGEKSTTFEAQSGLVDKEKKLLMLSGQVHVVKPQTKKGEKSAPVESKVVLTCDRLVYDGNTKLIKALGHVQVVGEVGTIGTLSELWATKDLKVVGTPDMFKAK